jgi:hypothetical protein
MGGFELSDDTLLKVSGISALAYCTFAVAAPREFHNTFMVVRHAAIASFAKIGLHP